MTEPPVLTPSVEQVAERPVDVGEDQNLIVVHAEGQRWISVVRNGVELVREEGGEPVAEFNVEPGSYVLRTDGSFGQVGVEHRLLAPPDAGLLTPVALATAAVSGAAALRVEVEAAERHPVDGMPQVPADGESSCTIRLEKVDAAGERLAGRGHTDEIHLRTTGGLLRSLDDDAPVRSVRLRAGQAGFRLVSEAQPKLVTVHAFAEDPALRAEVSVEFV